MILKVKIMPYTYQIKLIMDLKTKAGKPGFCFVNLEFVILYKDYKESCFLLPF